MAEISRFTDNSDVYEIPTIGKLLIKTNSNNKAVALIDPITDKILLDAGIALITSVGAKIFDKIFGKEDAPDIQTILRNLILEVVDILREVIDASDIRRATSIASGAATLLSEYSRSPDTVPTRLTDALSMSSSAVDELNRLLPTSASAYVFAVYTRLAALQQIAIDTKSESEAENFRAYARSSLPALLTATEDLVTRNRNRITPVALRIALEDQNHFRPGGQLPPVKWYVAYYTLDGVEKTFVSTKEAEARAAANERHAIDSKDLEDKFDLKIGILLNKTKENFETLSTWRRA